jgi:hypothetical protein
MSTLRHRNFTNRWSSQNSSNVNAASQGSVGQEFGLVVDRSISFFLPRCKIVGLVVDRSIIFASPLPSANDLRNVDRENSPPSATIVGNATERETRAGHL